MNYFLIVIAVILISICILAVFCLTRKRNESFENVCRDVDITIFNGLGDRLLDFIGLNVLTTITGYKFILNWRKDQKDRVYDINLLKFNSDIVDLHNGISIHNAEQNYDSCQKIKINNTDPSVTLSPYSIYVWLRDNGFSTPLKEIADKYIKVSQEIFPNTDLQKYIPNLTEYTAIHIRRTDKIWEFNNNMTKKADNFVDTLIKQSKGNCKLFILSDDERYKETYCKKLENIGKANNVNVIIYKSKELPINLPGAYSVYELFCMKQCKKIIQIAKHSNFSVLAATMSQNPMYNFNTFSRDWLLLVWKPCLDLYLLDGHFDHTINEKELNEAIGKKRLSLPHE